MIGCRTPYNRKLRRSHGCVARPKTPDIPCPIDRCSFEPVIEIPEIVVFLTLFEIVEIVGESFALISRLLCITLFPIFV
jgi:hypothetical protein